MNRGLTVFCVYDLFFVIIMLLYNFVTCCFALITYCSSALVMTNSTLNSTCSDDGSVNVYVCMYVCMYVHMYVLMQSVGKIPRFWMLSVVLNIVVTEFERV